MDKLKGTEGVKVKRFDDINSQAISEMNDFIYGKHVIDIKQSVLQTSTGNLYTQYLVIYQEEDYIPFSGSMYDLTEAIEGLDLLCDETWKTAPFGSEFESFVNEVKGYTMHLQNITEDME